MEPEDVFLQRIDALDRSLTQIKDRPVAIVGHSNVFLALTGRLLENCELHLYQPSESPLRTVANWRHLLKKTA